MFTKIITNPRFRSFLRNTGILKILGKIVVSKRNKNYEELFSKAMMSAIKQGNIAWDIGANIGLYTCKFAHAVGDTGKVIAFEPVKNTYLRMVRAYEKEGLLNVIPMQCALGHCDEQFSIPIATEGNGETNSLAKRGVNADNCEMITVRRGDSLINEGIPAPNIIKVDVEAFEEEVLFGLRNWLSSTSFNDCARPARGGG